MANKKQETKQEISCPGCGQPLKVFLVNKRNPLRIDAYCPCNGDRGPVMEFDAPDEKTEPELSQPGETL
jgi:hypothetical protein